MRLIRVQEGFAVISMLLCHTSYGLWKHWQSYFLSLFPVSTDQDPDPGHILHLTRGGMGVETILMKLANQKLNTLQNLEVALEMWEVKSSKDIPHRVHHHLILIY